MFLSAKNGSMCSFAFRTNAADNECSSAETSAPLCQIIWTPLYYVLFWVRVYECPFEEHGSWYSLH